MIQVVSKVGHELETPDKAFLMYNDRKSRPTEVRTFCSPPAVRDESRRIAPVQAVAYIRFGRTRCIGGR